MIMRNYEDREHHKICTDICFQFMSSKNKVFEKLLLKDAAQTFWDFSENIISKVKKILSFIISVMPDIIMHLPSKACVSFL